jgi:hypothetical protein
LSRGVGDGVFEPARHRCLVASHDALPDHALRSAEQARTLAGEPALPTTRCPRSFAICRARPPTAPADRDQDHASASG